MGCNPFLSNLIVFNEKFDGWPHFNLNVMSPSFPGVTYLPPANEVWGKVIFSEACVKNSVHRGWYLPPRGGGGVPGLGVSAPGGVPAPGGSAPRGVPGPGGVVCSQGGAWSGGSCLLPGGCLVRGSCLLQGGAWWRSPRMANAAGGTHPTGMHSRFQYVTT